MENKLIEKALEYLSSIEAFAGKEVPAFIQELIEFKIFEHLFGYFSSLFVWGIVSIISIYIAKRLYARLKSDDAKFSDGSYREDYIVPACLSVGLSITFVILFTINIFDKEALRAYKAYKAPRVYLVDYFKGQVK